MSDSIDLNRVTVGLYDLTSEQIAAVEDKIEASITTLLDLKNRQGVGTWALGWVARFSRKEREADPEGTWNEAGDLVVTFKAGGVPPTGESGSSENSLSPDTSA